MQPEMFGASCQRKIQPCLLSEPFNRRRLDSMDEIEEQFDLSKNIYLLVLDTDNLTVRGARTVAGLASGESHRGEYSFLSLTIMLLCMKSGMPLD